MSPRSAASGRPRWLRPDRLVPGWLRAGRTRPRWPGGPSTRGSQPRWLRLPRTVQARLTAVYVGLFVLFGAGLLTITYLLLQGNKPAQVRVAKGVLPGGGQRLCSFAGPALPNPAQMQGCARVISRQATAQHASDLSTLLVGSGVALAGMTVLAIGIGWLVAGRVLSPLRTISMATQRISASNLHERLELPGPDDELKELGDTVDGLLARLECSFEAQRQFVANASHELRTPLARQRTLVEVALADPEPTVDGLRTACGRVLAAGEQQERLIEALLTLARSQRGLDRWDLLDLDAIADEVVCARRADAQRMGVSIDVSPGTPASAALGDARLAERLVANLVDNALRYNVPGGWVSVWTGTTIGQAVLRITNSGPVVPPGEVARLFAPFQRLGASRTAAVPESGAQPIENEPSDARTADKRESPGLGLSIVSAIAAAHGAELQASAAGDGGLDIQVRFPPLPAVEPLPARSAAGDH